MQHGMPGHGEHGHERRVAAVSACSDECHQGDQRQDCGAGDLVGVECAVCGGGGVAWGVSLG